MLAKRVLTRASSPPPPDCPPIPANSSVIADPWPVGDVTRKTVTLPFPVRTGPTTDTCLSLARHVVPVLSTIFLPKWQIMFTTVLNSLPTYFKEPGVLYSQLYRTRALIYLGNMASYIHHCTEYVFVFIYQTWRLIIYSQPY